MIDWYRWSKKVDAKVYRDGEFVKDIKIPSKLVDEWVEDRNDMPWDDYVVLFEKIFDYVGKESGCPRLSLSSMRFGGTRDIGKNTQTFNGKICLTYKEGGYDNVPD